MKTINDVYELLGVKPFYDSIISRQNNIISGNTKAVLKGNAQKLYDLTEKLASIIVNPMSQKTPLNFKQICDEFIWASAGGVDRIQQIFDRRKKVRELVYALFYNFRKEAEPDKVILLDSNLCSMVLELVKKHNNRAIRKALLYFLTEYWTDLPSKIKSSILTCLVVSTKGIEQLRKNAFDIILEKNLIWVRPDGAFKLAQNLMSRDISVANNFFSENRIPQNDSYDLPLFIPFDKRKSYCADVLKFMLETERQSGKMGSYIQLMFQYSNSGYFSRDDVLRLLVAAMVKNPQLSHKEELKNTALNE